MNVDINDILTNSSHVFPAARRPSFARRMSDILAPESGVAKFDCKVEGFPMPEVKWYGLCFVYN